METTDKSKTAIKPQSLPPTKTATSYHSIRMYSVFNTLSEYTYFYISKNITS